MIELEINVSSTFYATTHAETLTWNSQTYRPIPGEIGEEAQNATGEIPRMFLDVTNMGGEAFRFAKDNDLSLNNVILRLINTSITTSGSDARSKWKIMGVGFNDEVARFNLSLGINPDAEGPARTYDRTTYPSIPIGFASYYVVVK